MFNIIIIFTILSKGCADITAWNLNFHRSSKKKVNGIGTNHVHNVTTIVTPIRWAIFPLTTVRNSCRKYSTLFSIHASERKIELIRQLDSVSHRSTWKGLVRKKQEKSHCYRLPEMLHKLMKEQNLTAKALAQKSNVPRSTIGGWATGVKPLNLSDVRKVARALGCSFEYLIFGSEETEDVQQPRKAVRSMTFQNAHRITIEFIE